MIPKIIHYCWFGGASLPSSAIKCINSWKKYFPNYEIKEWNESNFDVNMFPYTQEAYAAKKYAFVSDVARFWILYHEGGVYFDIDVEVIRSFDDILERGPFMGIETPSDGNMVPTVASGLGLGAEAGLEFLSDVVDFYSCSHFVDLETGEKAIGGTVVTHITSLLKDQGLRPTNELQKIAGIWIYPKDYFCPFNDNTGELKLTKNSHSIHWYSKSWIENYGFLRMWTARYIHRWLGDESLSWIKKLIKKD